MHKIAQGAEAIVYKDSNDVIKERFSKKYRLSHLDESLRKFRTRREAKLLRKLEELNFPAPRLKEFSDKRMSIVMDFIPGEKLKDVLKGAEGGDNYKQLAREIGQKVGQLHENNIIHNDLTTSNMIKITKMMKKARNGDEDDDDDDEFEEENEPEMTDTKKRELSFIDFGLSFFSEKAEDKAVDLFLLDRGLESTHFEHYPDIFGKVIEGYKETYPDADKVLERFEQVRKRGRNKKR
ncbi:MAG: RIO1 family regulatory kinase/ATPase [Nanoarchaeota archaeon]